MVGFPRGWRVRAAIIPRSTALISPEWTPPISGLRLAGAGGPHDARKLPHTRARRFQPPMSKPAASAAPRGDAQPPPRTYAHSSLRSSSLILSRQGGMAGGLPSRTTLRKRSESSLGNLRKSKVTPPGLTISRPWQVTQKASYTSRPRSASSARAAAQRATQIASTGMTRVRGGCARGAPRMLRPFFAAAPPLEWARSQASRPTPHLCAQPARRSGRAYLRPSPSARAPALRALAPDPRPPRHLRQHLGRARPTPRP